MSSQARTFMTQVDTCGRHLISYPSPFSCMTNHTLGYPSTNIVSHLRCSWTHPFLFSLSLELMVVRVLLISATLWDDSSSKVNNKTKALKLSVHSLLASYLSFCSCKYRGLHTQYPSMRDHFYSNIILR